MSYQTGMISKRLHESHMKERGNTKRMAEGIQHKDNHISSPREQCGKEDDDN